MTQTPITITYTLEEVLGQINTKLDKIDQRIEHMQEDITELKIGQVRLENEMKTLEVKLTGEIKTLDAKIDGIGKRLDTQEFINRSVVVGFVLAVGTAVIKILFPNLLT
jgi:predicted  nucleic acid-binding Zn-ribbon protein